MSATTDIPPTANAPRPGAIRDDGPQPVLVDRATLRLSFVGNLIAIVAYRELIKNLVLKDLKLKYRGSVVGFLWSLVNPIAMVGIYTIAFKVILGLRQPGFPFFILLGVLAWSFFANAAVLSTHTLVEGGSLVHAVRFPHAILPLATVLHCLVQYLLTISALLPVMFLFYHVPPLGPTLLFPVFLALQFLFTVGVALVLAAATTFFWDVRHFVDIGLSMLFWTTPIVYPLTQVSGRMRTAILLSPMSPFVVAYHSIFYYGEWPDTMIWMTAAAYGLGTFAIGTAVFLALEPRIGEQL